MSNNKNHKFAIERWLGLNVPIVSRSKKVTAERLLVQQIKLFNDMNQVEPIMPTMVEPSAPIMPTIIEPSAPIMPTIIEPSAPIMPTMVEPHILQNTIQIKDPELFECGVCLMDKPKENCIILSCNHELCDSCITSIKTTLGNGSKEKIVCPFCRSDITFVTKKISISDWR